MKAKQQQFPNITRAIAKGWELRVYKRFDDSIQATVARSSENLSQGSHYVGKTAEEAISGLDAYLMETAL